MRRYPPRHHLAFASTAGVGVFQDALDVDSLPPILAGPVLRRVTRTEASVWLALSRPVALTLRVKRASDPDSAFMGPSSPTTPVKVGSKLWMTVLQAPGPEPDGTFTAGEFYAYDIVSSSPGWAAPNWSQFAFQNASKPSFPAPPTNLEDLVVLHTSCRNNRGGGRDGFGLAADEIADRIDSAPITGAYRARPHLLIMSGDQVYADEHCPPIAPRVRSIAKHIVGIDEAGTVPNPFPSPFPDFPIGARQSHCEAFGLTSGVASDHLWSLGEFYAGYLLAWSDVLWPSDEQLPTWADAQNEGGLSLDFKEKHWNEAVARAKSFRAGLPNVKKVLATVPSLMVLDDHEVTDDWNLSFDWCKTVYTNPAGSRVVFNGLVAYVLCQHWGNRPDRFATTGTPEATFLTQVTYNGKTPDDVGTRSLIGMPAPTVFDEEPKPDWTVVLRDTPADPTALRYDFVFGTDHGWPVQVIALDERTWREFYDPVSPAARISMDALDLMLPVREAAGPEPPTFIIAPSPALGTHIVERIIQPVARLIPGGSIYADDESWGGAIPNHEDFVMRVASYAPVITLSGDVHYGVTSRFQYTRDGVTRTGAAITSSAGRNSDVKTTLLQLYGDLLMRLGVERPRTLFGYWVPIDDATITGGPVGGSWLPYDDMVDVLTGRVARAMRESPVVVSKEVAEAYDLDPPIWQYTVTPIDDQTEPSVDAITVPVAPAPWSGFNAQKSVETLKALRETDLKRIGRMFLGIPNTSFIWFTPNPLTVHHKLVGAVGSDPTSKLTQAVKTSAALQEVGSA